MTRSDQTRRGRRFVTLAVAVPAFALALGCAGSATEDLDTGTEASVAPLTLSGVTFLEPDRGATGGTFDAFLSADTVVSSTDPTANYGAATTVWAAYGNDKALVRFEVRAMTQITNATLMFFVPACTSCGSSSSTLLALGSDAFEEANVNFHNYASFTNTQGQGPTIATFPTSPRNGGVWLSVDVTPTVKGNGVYTFVAFQPGGVDGVVFSSKEGSNPPRLVLTGAQNPPPSNLSWCPGTQVPNDLLATIPASTGIGESSGLAASHAFGNTYYTHNDGTDRRIFAIRNTGALRATLTISADYHLVDSEDIQVGPGPDPQVAFVYLGDIGDNLHNRGTVEILRFREPSMTDQTLFPDVLSFHYPNNEKINAEAFIIDPVTGSLFVIEKRCTSSSIGGTDGVNRIFKLDAPLPFNDGAQVELTDTGRSIKLGADTGNCSSQTASANNRVTGSAVDVIGDRLAVTTYDKVILYYRPIGQTIDLVLGLGGMFGSLNKCTNTQVGYRKREAISFSSRSLDGYFTTDDNGVPASASEIHSGVFRF